MRKEEREANERLNEGYDMKIFGYSFRDSSNSFKLVYPILIFAVIAGALFYAFRELDPEKKNPKKKPEEESKQPKEQAKPQEQTKQKDKPLEPKPDQAKP